MSYHGIDVDQAMRAAHLARIAAGSNFEPVLDDIDRLETIVGNSMADWTAPIRQCTLRLRGLVADHADELDQAARAMIAADRWAPVTGSSPLAGSAVSGAPAARWTMGADDIWGEECDTTAHPSGGSSTTCNPAKSQLDTLYDELIGKPTPANPKGDGELDLGLLEEILAGDLNDATKVYLLWIVNHLSADQLSELPADVREALEEIGADLEANPEMAVAALRDPELRHLIITSTDPALEAITELIVASALEAAANDPELFTFGLELYSEMAALMKDANPDAFGSIDDHPTVADVVNLGALRGAADAIGPFLPFMFGDELESTHADDAQRITAPDGTRFPFEGAALLFGQMVLDPYAEQALLRSRDDYAQQIAAEYAAAGVQPELWPFERVRNMTALMSDGRRKWVLMAENDGGDGDFWEDRIAAGLDYAASLHPAGAVVVFMGFGFSGAAAGGKERDVRERIREHVLASDTTEYYWNVDDTITAASMSALPPPLKREAPTPPDTPNQLDDYQRRRERYEEGLAAWEEAFPSEQASRAALKAHEVGRQLADRVLDAPDPVSRQRALEDWKVFMGTEDQAVDDETGAPTGDESRVLDNWQDNFHAAHGAREQPTRHPYLDDPTLNDMADLNTAAVEEVRRVLDGPRGRSFDRFSHDE